MAAGCGPRDQVALHDLDAIRLLRPIAQDGFEALQLFCRKLRTFHAVHLDVKQPVRLWLKIHQIGIAKL